MQPAQRPEIAGIVDVGSYRAGVPFRGAGANPPGGCTFTTPPFGATIGGGGGGYGGSFGTRGGDGSNSVPMSGLNGRAGDALLGFPPALRGGCRGGDGGAIAGPEGQGGDGAGAVALIAAQIHIDGRIDASGSGGHGGFAGSGGGGGGSGGMIVVDSGTTPSFANTAKLWANGGGGGQGGASGMPGSDGEESNAPTHQGLPGLSGSGATGGGGSVGSGPGISAGQDTLNGGGGGGGGGAGFILAPGLTDPVAISPPSSGS